MGLFKKSKQEEPVIRSAHQDAAKKECCCKHTEKSRSEQTQSAEEFSTDEPSAVCQDGCCCCCSGDCIESKESVISGTGDSGITIKILGSGCKNCIMLYENVHTALKELGLQAEVVKVTDLAEITGYGVMSTPAMVINEKVVSYGKVLKPAEVKKLLERDR